MTSNRNLLQSLAPAAAVLIAVSCGISSCTTSSEELAKSQKENQQLKQENQELKAKVAELTTSASTKTSTESAATPTPTQAATSATSNQFSDIAGEFGEKEIKDLLKIGVLDTGSSGKFEPTKPITRAEFVKWAVKANNVLRPGKAVRLAETSDPSSFSDLTSSDPNFNYIQGMANAGWSVGYDDKTFKPEKFLTREEMIAIKAPFDGMHPTAVGSHYQYWGDWKDISKQFYDPMDEESGNYYPNWKRIYGNTKICIPKKSVSRAEAAVCVWQFGCWGGDSIVNAGDPPKK